MQSTIKSSVEFTGIGLHSGHIVTMVLHPAPTDHGISFQRLDILGAPALAARFDQVGDTQMCTKLGHGQNTVGTIEHIMAALAGCGLNNVHVTLTGPEVPIMDGSSAEFIRGILLAGVMEQDRPLKALKVLKTVRFQDQGVWAELSPCDQPKISFAIEFDTPVIGAQSKSMSMANGAFVRELCDSRTFVRKTEVDMLQANGLGLGGSLQNAVVVDGDIVLNPEGFRHPDECVRHKMLDALGDLYLAGGPILGHYTGYRAGHRITNELLHVLFATEGAFEWIECDPVTSYLMPGSDLKQSDLALIA
ncbi:MAG: UDP-3-O-acyl-N-acetylglucosamine deacetylase [Pseudomonadota bacterium]